MHSMFNRFFLYSIILFLAMLSGNAAMAQKGKSKSTLKKNSIFHRLYHDITCKYNFFFNARELLRQDSKQLIAGETNDYTNLLDVFVINTENAKGMAADWETVFKKTSIAIQLHPTSKWVDDAYLMMGQAEMFKGDFTNAIVTFQYIDAEFKNGNKLHKYKARKSKNKLKPNEEEELIMPDYSKIKDVEEEKELKKEEAAAKEAKTESKKPTPKKKPVAKKKPTKKPTAKLSKYGYKKKKKKYAPPPKKPVAKKPTTTAGAYTPKVTSPDKYGTTGGNKVVAKPKSTVLNKDVSVSINIGNKNKKLTNYSVVDSAAVAKALAEEPKGIYSKLRHKPIAYQSELWLARTFIEQKNYTNAETIFSDLKTDTKFPSHLQDDLYAILADFYVKKEDYTNAKAALSVAANYTKNKQTKARYYFILGQLLEKENNYKESIKYFGLCEKQKPNFDMIFNAKLNTIILTYKAGNYKATTALQVLKQMTNEQKNSDYLDQIYIAMADIAIDEKNIDVAITYLKEATKVVGSKSTTIKQNAYKKIADIYYTNEVYIKSKSYYDSTLTLIKPTDTVFEVVNKRTENLKKIVPYLLTIQLEDSLQKIAMMKPEDLENFINKILKVAQDKLDQKNAEQEINTALSNSTTTTPNSNIPNASQWYFYSKDTKSAGYNEFQKKWGTRTNSDSWRRSIKNNNANSTEAEDVQMPNIDNKAIDNLNKKLESGEVKYSDIEKLLPNSPAKKKLSDDKLIDALYASGGLYNTPFSNAKKSIEQFERLVKQFKGNKYEEKTYYQLYTLHTKVKNFPKALQYANALKQEYGSSMYAKLIDNPNYIATSQAPNAAQSLYEQTFEQYQAEKYKEVLANAKKADSLYKNNTYQAKFYFLQAVALSKLTASIDTLKYGLNSLIIKYPNDEIVPKAQAILNQLKAQVKPNKNGTVIGTDTTNTTIKTDAGGEEIREKMFSKNKKEKHWVILVIAKTRADAAEIAVSDYNTQTNSMLKLKTSKIVLNDKQTIIVIKDFKNGDAAAAYANEYKKNTAFWSKHLDQNKELLPINTPNFNSLLKSKSIALYKVFASTTYQ